MESTREELEARRDNLRAELARREVESLSTSELQARYVTGRGRSEDIAEDRDVDEPAWGDDGEERPEQGGDRASRRQAAYVTRGASSRGGDE